MNVLPLADKVSVLRCLVDGNSIRATVRITGVAKNTISSLLVRLGKACWEYQNQALRKLRCRRLECDELWSFCYAREKNVPKEQRGVRGFGDVWTWIAIDADTKLIPSWQLGPRNQEAAITFMQDLRGRLARRVQLTTDGLRFYFTAVEEAFGTKVDYATLLKKYGSDDNKEYCKESVESTEKRILSGNPDLTSASTSFVERNNLTMRMCMRRYTRKSNGFSKKIENMEAAVSLHMMYYNFIRDHQTLGTTPAISAGIARDKWTLEGLVKVFDENSN